MFESIPGVVQASAKKAVWCDSYYNTRVSTFTIEITILVNNWKNCVESYVYICSIGRGCIDEILAGVNNITEDITKEPETAGELVAFNFLLDKLESRVAFLEERLEYLRELYDLMGEYNIPIPPDDMTEYLGIQF